MAEDKLCELYIINLITNNRRVGNVILEPKEKQFVSFFSLTDIKYAIKLHNRREISIETELPEEVMQMLEEDPHIPDTTIPKPPVSIALVYQNEFKQYKEDTTTKLEDLTNSVSGKVVQGSNVNNNTSADKPYLEIINKGAAAGLHITNSPGFTGPYIMGIGKDAEGTGLMLPNKANGKMISGEQRSTVTDASSYWMKVTQQSTAAALLRLEQNIAGAAAALQLQSFGTTTPAQHLLYVGNQQGEIGKIYAGDGSLTWLKDIKVHDSNASGGKLKLLSGVAADSQSHVIGDSKGLEWYNYSGSANVWYPFAIKVNSNTLSIQAGANTNAVGTATRTDVIKVQNNKLGFFDATPVTKRTGVAVTAEAIHAALVSLGLITA